MATPEDQIEAAVLTQQGALRADLLGRIGENSPAFVAGLIVDLTVEFKRLDEDFFSDDD